MLAEQGDLCIGMFFPDLAHSKWGALTAFSCAAVMIYFGHNSAAETEALKRKIEARAPQKERDNAPPINSNLQGFGATL